MVFKDGKADFVQTGDGVQLEDIVKLLQGVNNKDLVSSIGEMVSMKIKEAITASGMAVAGGAYGRDNEEDNSESLKSIAEAMASSGKGIQMADGKTIGREQEVTGDAGKNSKTIDLLGNL